MDEETQFSVRSVAGGIGGATLLFGSAISLPFLVGATVLDAETERRLIGALFGSVLMALLFGLPVALLGGLRDPKTTVWEWFNAGAWAGLLCGIVTGIPMLIYGASLGEPWPMMLVMTFATCAAAGIGGALLGALACPVTRYLARDPMRNSGVDTDADAEADV